MLLGELGELVLARTPGQGRFNILEAHFQRVELVLGQ